MNSKSDLKIKDIEHIFRRRKPGTEEFFKFFSILVPVVEKDGKLYLLYEVRAKHMVRQPGEICFPGGELEGGESLETCALRETWEEIGIPAGKIRIVSQLDTIFTYSNFAMYCYLGIVDESALQTLQLNPDEVEEVFLVSLDELLENDPDVYWTKIVPQPPADFPYYEVTGGEPYNWRQGKAPVPVYKAMDGRRIWGLTARITKRFVDIVRRSMKAGCSGDGMACDGGADIICDGDADKVHGLEERTRDGGENDV